MNREDGRPLLACAACKEERCCSTECQRKCWKAHKKECKKIEPQETKEVKQVKEVKE